MGVRVPSPAPSESQDYVLGFLCFMGPEILIAFFMFLGLLFWGAVKVIWWILKRILNLIFIPWMYVTNIVREKFWGLPKREKGNHFF